MEGLRMRSRESSVEEEQGGGAGIVERQEAVTANAVGESGRRRRACGEIASMYK